MKKNIVETLMGALVLVIAAGFLWFSYKSSDLRVEKGYHLTAHFHNAAGISAGSDVRMAGIKVGVISKLELDSQSYEAVLTLEINQSTQLPTDSNAAIVSSGLLGEKYVQITPGGEDAMFVDGGKIEFTQSAVNLEEMIGKMMFSGGGVEKKSAAPASAAPATPSLTN